ncbi:MAG TPA: site-2 protease family protein [Acidimicrobiales bacterium]|nr:site-2 protease family protein [Acidimicrobiales bacterium]
MRQTIRLGTWFGIPIGMNWSMLVLLALFAWELAEYEFPHSPGHANAADWVAGVVGALGLLVSLTAHEMSHSLVARHNGVAVRSITLFLFGGVSQLEGEAHTPGADFRIAAVGPATSVMAAGVFGAIEALARWGGVHGLPVATIRWLWEINLVLAAFNMIPGAPLDGGRVLRSALWRRWGDQLRASVAAARAGIGFAVFLIVVGVLTFLYVGFTGLWAALIGFFLYSAARGEEQYAQVRESLVNVLVWQVMTPHPPAVPGRTTVADLVTHYLWHYRGGAVAVVDDTGMLAGVVTAEAVRSVPPGRRHEVTVAQIALPLGAVPVARQEEPMSALLERMASHEGHPALVLDSDNRLAGIVTLSDVERLASLNRGWSPPATGRR